MLAFPSDPPNTCVTRHKAIGLACGIRTFLIVIFSLTVTDARLVDDRLEIQYISAYPYHNIIPFSADRKVNRQWQFSEDRLANCATLYSPTPVLK